MIRDPDGQAVLELAMAAAVAAVALGAAALVLDAAWHRAQCSYLVFEAAHSRLVGSLPPPGADAVPVQSVVGGAIAFARCGGAEERVALPDLESARW